MSKEDGGPAFPFDAYVLTPGFNVKIVKIVGEARYSVDGWFLSDAGATYHIEHLAKTKADAIERGKSRLEKMHQDIAKRVASFEKKAAALAKAERAK